jgi:hypothetical protein
LGVEALEDRAVPATFTAANVAELIGSINAANLTSDEDTIALAPGKTFTLTEANNTLHGATGLPGIAAAGGKLIIFGNGDAIERSTAKGTPTFRLFDVAVGASLTLQNLTLQGGVATGGGAVFNQGALTMTAVTVQGNTAQGAAGGFAWGGSYPGGDAAGGGIYSTGELAMDGCTVRNNTAVGGRGVNGGTYTVYTTDFPFSYKQWAPGSDGGDAFGGGVYVGGGTVTITHSDVTTNSAKGGMGGSKGGSDGHGIGGGVYITPADGVYLDDYTATHTKKNTASTSNPDIFGSYT